MPFISAARTRWLMDTGSGHDIMSIRNLSKALAKRVRKAEPHEVLTFDTANGSLQADKLITLSVKGLAAGHREVSARSRWGGSGAGRGERYCGHRGDYVHGWWRRHREAGGVAAAVREGGWGERRRAFGCTTLSNAKSCSLDTDRWSRECT